MPEHPACSRHQIELGNIGVPWNQTKLEYLMLPASGVIGRRMKMEAFVPAIPEVVATLGKSQQDGHRAAVAMTTTGAWGIMGLTIKC